MSDETLMSSIDILKDIVAHMKDDEHFRVLDSIESEVDAINKSWSGSWLGYHSRVYLSGFVKPVAGERFSPEWGLMDSLANDETVGDWVEYSPEDIQAVIEQRAGVADWEYLEKKAVEAKDVYEDEYVKIVSRLEAPDVGGASSVFVDLMRQIKELKVLDSQEIIRSLVPSKNIISRDSTAISAGIIYPAHLKVYADLLAVRSPYMCAEQLVKLLDRVMVCMKNGAACSSKEREGGKKVFIGHGSSLLWRELKDFIQERLNLEHEEFNRVSVAGLHTVERLKSMMEESAFAFIVMTGEDETEGGMQPRLNVVHEAGLFQGWLGFDKSIILLEENCEEFSNIVGLSQIRFPKGRISSCFEEVRKVLEREGVIGS